LRDTLRRMTFRTFTLLAVAAAAFASPQARKRADDPDMREIRDYRLSLEKIQKYIDASKALQKDPAASACFKDKPPGNQATIDLGQKQIEACPAAVADMKSAGLTPREFLVLTGSLIGNVFAMEMKRQGTIKQYPDSVSPENAAFLDQNYDKVKAMVAPLMGQGGSDK
jgi:hypothetical protein